MKSYSEEMRKYTDLTTELRDLWTFNKFNSLKPKFVYITLKNSVRTAKKTQHFTITKTNWLTLFKEIIAVYSENNTKPINTLCGQNNVELGTVKVGGAYSYHWVLKCD
jgi:hypothetical protein